MQIIFFSSNFDTIDEFKNKHSIKDLQTCYDTKSLDTLLNTDKNALLIVDFDSVASELNKLIVSDLVPKNTIVLERSPEITTGKMLIKRGVKAYGNIQMLPVHYTQMMDTVSNEKVWTYPKLTAALVGDTSSSKLNEDSQTLIENRLSPKEIEVVHHILGGLTNDGVALKLNITTRTVKAHVSSIFTKLHVNDRISLVLLLK